MTCADIYEDSDLGPLGINYVYIYKCSLVGFEPLTWFLYMIWTIYLIYLLGNTAAVYFSPTLGYICEKLKLPYNVAGVTFLAFGNGSPDMFSTLTAFVVRSGSEVAIGLSALLGGAIFVTSVVVGSVAICCPGPLTRNTIVRDISGMIVAITSLFFISLTYSTFTVQRISVLAPIILLLLYGGYVYVVLSGFGASDDDKFDVKDWFYRLLGWQTSNIRKKVRENDSEFAQISMQTAFWHPTVRDDSLRAMQSEITNEVEDVEMGEISSYYSGSGYTFITMDQSSDAPPSNDGSDNEDDEDDGGAVTINLGGVIRDRSQWNSYSNEGASMSNGGINIQINDDYFSLGGEASSSPNNTALNEPLLVCSEGPDIDYNMNLPKPGKKHGKSKKSGKNTTIYDLDPIECGVRYWQQLKLRRRLQSHLFESDFWLNTWYSQFITVLLMPMTILRNCTIPTSDAQLWNKSLAVVQPVAATVLFLYVSGYFSQSQRSAALFDSVWILGLISSTVVSFLVFLFTNTSKPPSTKVFGIIWVLFGFVMCVVWIYLLAGELVSCLCAIGIIANIPSAVLGLTVLAWGNSVGDLFSNIAVAQRGLTELAVAGCYGGPVFNLLVGFGLSLLCACIIHYNDGFVLPYEPSALISFLFLYIILITSYLYLQYVSDFRLTKSFGYYLISVYALYTLVQALLQVAEDV